MSIAFREFQKSDMSMIKEFSKKVTQLFDDWNTNVLFMLDDPKNLLYGAFQNNKILGFANLKKKSEKLA